MPPARILISGGGIAGLTLAVALKHHGFDPLVIEREPKLRAEGYMMDFFGTGWDVAERMGLTDDLRAVRYPIDVLDFVTADGNAFVHMPIDRLRRALDNRYVYLRRQDLEHILAKRAHEAGVEIRYATSLAALDERGDGVHARYDDGGEDEFALVIGADGVHSQVRNLVFGPESRFARFLGLHVAAFHVASDGFPVHNAVRIYEEPNRSTFFYSLDRNTMDATYVFRHAPAHVPKAEQPKVLRQQYEGAGWIAENVLRARADDSPLYFDSVTQIVMPQWYRGRVALIGDACGCLTLLAGQGSHMAMAGAYVLAQELGRRDDHTAAFAAYQSVMKPPVDRKQKDAARFAGLFVPSERSRPWLRRLTLRLLFSGPLIGFGLSLFGVRSVLRGWS